MPVVVSVQEAEADLPGLLRRAECGEDVLIVREGRPAVRLVPADAAARGADAAAEARAGIHGFMRGRIRMAPDFDEWPDDVRRMLEDPDVLPGGADPAR